MVEEAKAGGAAVQMGGVPDPGAGPLHYRPTILTQGNQPINDLYQITCFVLTRKRYINVKEIT